jgi:glycosyltransferase involved in cell wall biosynthesis
VLSEQLFKVLKRLSVSFEVIVVDDGSTDRSLGVLRVLAGMHRQLRVIDLARNYGQTAAVMAPLDHTRDEVIVPFDADLQNDPEDIPRLLANLGEGYDVVSGWRKDRKNAAIRRNFVSRIANIAISVL